ncbi:hypothetical protein R84981_001426 [Carnimonas sp. R-84981]|uniref:DVU3141 family protein n=1 Tax=Carnimonas bestiolae TaxID=3402172 RepID=UPI003EDC26FD
MTVNFKRFGIPRRWRLLALLSSAFAFSVALAGCATGPDLNRGNINGVDSGVPAGPQLSSFLDHASPGSTATVFSSPLGNNATVNVEDSYFSGTGLKCLRLNVAAAVVSPGFENSIACRNTNADDAQDPQQAGGRWKLQRSIINQVQPEYINRNSGSTSSGRITALPD